MLRKSLASLFCALALTAPAFSRVFLFRANKGAGCPSDEGTQARAKPEKPKEVVSAPKR